MKTTATIILCSAVLLSACGKSSSTMKIVGNSPEAKIEKAINDGLAKDPTCVMRPIGIPMNKEQKALVAKDGYDKSMKALMQAGLVTEGSVSAKDIWGKIHTEPGLVFTEKGNAFIAVPAQTDWPTKQACVRTGVKTVGKIHAVDYTTDATGSKIATVRMSHKYVLEEWIQPLAQEAKIKEFEAKQYVYKLMQSGDDFFYQGQGKELK